MWRWLISAKEAMQVRTYRTTECGHKTKALGTWNAHGEERLIDLNVESGSTPYCHNCIEKMTIQCAWCGLPIFVADPISLSFCTDPDWAQPDYAVEHATGNRMSLVGCMRWDCADSGLSFAGHWATPGKVQKAVTPIMLAMQAAEAGVETPIIFNDISDPEQVQIDAAENAARISEDAPTT